ncbi:MAG: CAP domain-containing protein [Pseudarcicella sp.]|nr:CAP domain-containing protein [Pseudarcicella sp.]MBP6410507.1 CAP domain-containing protein [Pseudarcicella sp.]
MKIITLIYSIICFFSIHSISQTSTGKSIEDQMIEKINNYRTSRKLGKLQKDSIICVAAIAIASCNAKQSDLSHTCNGTFCKRLKAINYVGAENLTTYSTVEEAFQAWLKSPSHHANMIRKEDLYIGIAFVSGKKQNVWSMIAGTPNCEDCQIECR